MRNALIVANRTVGGDQLQAAVHERLSSGPVHVPPGDSRVRSRVVGGGRRVGRFRHAADHPARFHQRTRPRREAAAVRARVAAIARSARDRRGPARARHGDRRVPSGPGARLRGGDRVDPADHRVAMAPPGPTPPPRAQGVGPRRGRHLDVGPDVTLQVVIGQVVIGQVVIGEVDPPRPLRMGRRRRHRRRSLRQRRPDFVQVFER